MNSNESSEPSAQLPVHQWPWIEFQLIMLSVSVKFCSVRKGEESLIDSFFFSFSFSLTSVMFVPTGQADRASGLCGHLRGSTADQRLKAETRILPEQNDSAKGGTPRQQVKRGWVPMAPAIRTHAPHALGEMHRHNRLS